MKTLREQIEKIVTYYSEDGEGTAGYLLSTKQIDQLEALIQSRERALVERIQADLVFMRGNKGQADYIGMIDGDILYSKLKKLEDEAKGGR